MNWHTIVDSVARKQIKKFPRKEADHLVAVMVTLEQNPYEGDVVKLQGERDIWLRRVGSYRMFYEIHTQERIIYVFNIKRRTSSTY